MDSNQTSSPDSPDSPEYTKSTSESSHKISISSSQSSLSSLASSSQPRLAIGYTWLLFYFLFNLSLTIYNKAVMQFYAFSFPWTLTAIHTACSGIGCLTLAYTGYFVPAKLSSVETLVMISFSVLYTINIAISNLSLNMVTIPFHQTVRATVPLFTMLIEVILTGKAFSVSTTISMIPTTMGVALATIGDYDYTTIGLFLTLLGTILAAVKGIVTNRVQVGKLKLHPLDLLLRMSPLALIQTLLYASVTGELGQVSEYLDENMSLPLLWALLGNGIIAFALNLTSFTANKLTSALTMGVAGNVKQVLSIVLSVVIFQLRISGLNALGICLTLFGGCLYTHFEIRDKLRKRQATSSVKATDPKYHREKEVLLQGDDPKDSSPALQRKALKPRRTIRSMIQDSLRFGKRLGYSRFQSLNTSSSSGSGTSDVPP